MPGASFGRWAGRYSGPSGALPSATRTPSPAGSSRTGPGSAKNARRRGAWLVFLDESGVSFTPPVRRTWAPRGRTPILRHRQRHWSRLSIAGMCCYRPDGTRARLAVHLQPGSYNDQVLIGVLGQLRRFLGGQKVTLLWDGLPSHRSRRMQSFIASQRGWLVLERLPGYAPELNPVEGHGCCLRSLTALGFHYDHMSPYSEKLSSRRGRARRRGRRGTGRRR